MNLKDQIAGANSPENIEAIVKDVAIKFAEWYTDRCLQSEYVNMSWENLWAEFKAEYENDHTH